MEYKRKDGAPLTRLEKIILEQWIDFIVEENTIGSSIFATTEDKMYYPTSDGKFMCDAKEAIKHEKEFLLNEYEKV